LDSAKHSAHSAETFGKRKWVGLTDDDLMKEFRYADELMRDTAYRVEQLLKDKNT
jgi:hypothetical protein